MAGVLAVSAWLAGAPVSGAAPERPRARVDTAPVPATGRTIAVAAGGNVQAALDAAQPGDVVTLAAGATFQGPFTLPRKSGAGWITVRTSAPDASLPAGTRVGPAAAAAMPKLVAAAGRYPLPRYFAAVVLGGIPYFALLAWLGHEFPIPPWVLLALVMLVALGFLFERWRKRGRPRGA